jgi:hypothetical protein
VQFRLDKPDITEARCRACVILGGCEVETEAQAREFSRLDERAEDPVRVGEFLELPPCVGEVDLEWFRREHDRPCPRVELRVENADALSLFRVSVREDARPLAAPLFEALCGGLPADERARTIHRVLSTLNDETVSELLYPKAGG